MDYISTAFKKYATFSGRARRAEYWYFVLFVSAISFIIGFIEGLLGLASDGQGILSLVFALATIVPTIAVGIRRMHDVNKSGWFLIIPIYSLILTLKEGTKGDNEYGADPKAADVKIADTSSLSES